MDMRNAVATFQDELRTLDDTALMLMIDEASKLKRSIIDSDREIGRLLLMQCSRAAHERGW